MVASAPGSVPTYRFADLDSFRLPLGCRLVGIEITDDAIELMKASLRRPDFKEGVASFLQKRTPDFQPVQPA